MSYKFGRYVLIFGRNQIYFDKIHPSMPAIHRPRFMAALDLAPHMRPPACLRYAMWCSAASVSEKYKSCQQHFYERARKYAQLDEMKSFGEATITVSHAQCWVLIGAYEFKMMHYPRAWLSVGRAARLAQMMGLQRLDGPSIDVKQCIPLPRDWTEREERRRTFWMVFVEDRYASVGTGWPMMIEETDVSRTIATYINCLTFSLTQTPCSDHDILACIGGSLPKRSACGDYVFERRL